MERKILCSDVKRDISRYNSYIYHVFRIVHAQIEDDFIRKKKMLLLSYLISNLDLNNSLFLFEREHEPSFLVTANISTSADCMHN